MSTAELRQSPLHHQHTELGATFTAFGPWSMPLKYDNELAEHRAVRTAAGLFDLSHMGEIWVTGDQAAEFLSYALISDFLPLKVGKAKYSMMVAEDGGIIDDLIVYRFEEHKFLVVPNAGNAATVAEQFAHRSTGFEVTLNDESLDVAMLALQGPRAAELLAGLIAAEHREQVLGLEYYSATFAKVAGIFAVVARTGYTGEDGFELIVYNNQAAELWHSVLGAGGGDEVIPCGLAARDSLRLEAGMPLYGNELSREISPIEAGMGRAIASRTGDFVAADILRQRLQDGPTHRIVGLVSQQKRAARAGSTIYLDGQPCGTVSSGQPSPTLGHPVALALVATSAGLTEGDAVEVDIRGKRYPFTVAATPFYRRPETA